LEAEMAENLQLEKGLVGVKLWQNLEQHTTGSQWDRLGWSWDKPESTPGGLEGAKDVRA
jgi:hypothetical protein